MAEHAVRFERADWFRTALSSIGDAVIVADGAGRVAFMNPVAEALTGWPEAEALGQSLPRVFRIVNEETRKAVDDPVAAVLARGVVVGLASHTVLIDRAGTERFVDDSAAPIRDRAGALVGAVLVFRDADERRRAERCVNDALAYAEGIVNTVREPLLVLDAGLRVRTANRSFYRTFGATPAETEGRALQELGSGQWDVPGLRQLLEQVLAEDGAFNDFEVTHDFPGIGRRTMLLNGRRLPRHAEGAGLVLLAAEDVTEARSAAHALGVSESRYRRLFETAQDGILILDAGTGRISDANPFLLDMLGYAHGELAGKELWQIGLFRDIEASRTAFRRLQQEGYIRYEDLPLQTKDGRHLDVEFVSNVYLVDGRPVVQCNIRDVTDRKRAEERLRQAHDELERRVAERTAELGRVNAALRAEVAEHGRAEAARQELQLRLAAAQEEERHRLARELHDQMGQHLTALSLGLKVLRDGEPADAASHPRLRQLQELTELMGKEIHQIALDLRPTALDDLGLRTALVNYAEAWSERSRVAVDFQSSGLDGERLPAPLETALYRVLQEALTNVLKHSQAGRVSVVLHRTEGQVTLVVEDDGRGFDAEARPGATGGTGRLGLLGMQERLTLVGGTLTVESAPGGGASVFARVPLPASWGCGGD